MRTVDFPYGKTKQTAHIPESYDCQIISSKILPQPKCSESIVEEALQSPISSQTLKELSHDVKNIVIITNDNTRPMPSKITLPLIIRQFYYPESHYDITILIATGLHRMMTEEEMANQYGDEFCRTHRVVCHDATNQKENVKIGVLTSGNELYLNRIAANCDLLISEGFIEPHFFAGFSGGRKSVMPGVAGELTIMQNHCPQNIAHAKARQATLTNNPIHEECMEAAKMANLRFIMNVALNDNKEIVAAFAGDPVEAHRKGCRYVEEIMTVPVKQTDIVVTSNNGHPLDRNLYQVVKGIDTAAKVVKPGGVIIAVAQCEDGIGHREFGELIRSCSTLQELSTMVSTPPLQHDKWQVQILVRALEKATLILVNDVIDAKILRRMFIEAAPSVDEALQTAVSRIGPDATISFIPDGPVIIPVLS
ncbi:MAG: nickel-dependent lactate racemase [Oscillospiraceae bacterium]|nr:nickel-dependent lactate racemase [Oscillospiraceae bacterium]